MGKIKITPTTYTPPKEADHRKVIGHREADLTQSLGKRLIYMNNLGRYKTPDRGKVISKHNESSEELEVLRFYFANPHSPWQRGTYENTKGLIPEYSTKKRLVRNHLKLLI